MTPATRRTLLLIVFAALVARLAIWPWFSGIKPHIFDERDYDEIATSLAERGEFAMDGEITSARPPLYPAVVAVVYRAAGVGDHQAVRLLQILLNVALLPIVFGLGRRLYDERTGLLAAAITAFYPSLWGHNYLVLTEVLFTLLLAAGTLALVADADRPRWSVVALAAVLFGLATLARTSALLYPPLFAIVTFAWSRAPSARRIATVALFTALFVLTLAPWIARNTRLHGRFASIDSYSNMTAAKYSPLRHLFEREGATWAVRPTRERAGLARTGDPGSFASRRRSAAPRDELTTSGLKTQRIPPAVGQSTGAAAGGRIAQTARTASEVLTDALWFWRIDREIPGAAARGFLGPLPRWLVLAVTGVVALYYIALMLAGTAGLSLRPPGDRHQLAIVLSVVAVLFGVHTLSIGHSRYHIPVMPMIAIFAARLLLQWGEPAPRRRTAMATGLVALLVASWTLTFVRFDLFDVREQLERKPAAADGGRQRSPSSGAADTLDRR